jgi:UDP-N-acetylglucosamine 2-epimerase (non-hydrolysing)
MDKLRPLLLIGTRPEAVKLAPLVRVFHDRADRVAARVCFTGQHRELLDQAAGYFGLCPDIDLRLMTPDQSPAGFLGRCIEALDGVLRQHRPDCVIGQGDTASALAAAMAAFYRRTPFVHVEAGLRTGDLDAPWPEEFHRRAIALAAVLHCAPTPRAARQLIDEGIPADAVHVTGNTVVDALLWTLERERADPSRPGRLAAAPGRRIALVTCHRRETFGLPLRGICQAIDRLAARWPGVDFVFPVHPNPQVAGPVRDLLGGRANVRLLPPLAYPEFVCTLAQAALVMTDSGGVQEEAPSLGVPVLVLRACTERPEAVEAGCAELTGADPVEIERRAHDCLSRPPRVGMPPFPNPFGDGRAAERIADLVENCFCAAGCPALDRSRVPLANSV